MMYDVILGLTLMGFGGYGLRWVARETYGTEVCDGEMQ